MTTNCTPAALHEILERVSRGELPAMVCVDHWLPTWSELKAWCDRDPDVRARLADATEAGEHFLLAECLTIADTPCEAHEDEHELAPRLATADDPDEPAPMELRLVKRKTKDALGHRTLRVSTRVRVLEKLNPRRWGAKVEVEAGADLAAAIAAARARATTPDETDSPTPTEGT